eukprot:TRINITY_DN2130_c0_g1_i1.p1 TRINITY_DN2130_c0_g1~~TRINITY_DN2130_c0_g1_i1.p1  ORF type:complete len:263 (+),score=22.99 TRINITY_DN2130_c0_g1_i1:66-854(+)
MSVGRFDQLPPISSLFSSSTLDDDFKLAPIREDEMLSIEGLIKMSQLQTEVFAHQEVLFQEEIETPRPLPQPSPPDGPSDEGELKKRRKGDGGSRAKRTRSNSSHLELTCSRSGDPEHKTMQKFLPSETADWKHVLYNLLVENHNQVDKNTLLIPCQAMFKGKLCHGFHINSAIDSKKLLAELYAFHLKGIRLTETNVEEGIYKKYLRSALQLISKYFSNAGPGTYVYGKVPLFVPNEAIQDAAVRLRSLDTRQRTESKHSS